MHGKRIKVLILSGDLGDGHQQAAKALLETAGLYHPDIEVNIINFMELTHPYLHSMVRYLFVQGVKKFPSVYGYLYQKTRLPSSSSLMLKKFKLYSMGRIMKLLQDMEPTVVVNTFPGAAAAMSLIKVKGLTTVPMVTVITDHTDHSYWVHPCTDQYIVGSEHVRSGLRSLGVPDSQIAVTGIPVRPPFYWNYHRDSLREKHNLNPELPTMLVMGGGCGIIDKAFQIC